MENTDQIHSFIRLVMNENLAQAQSVIQEALNAKLSAALDEKFEAYAPAIFEELDAVGQEDSDIDNDDKKMTKRDRYLLNRRKVRGAAINEGEEGDEEEVDEEETEEETDEGDEGDEQQMQGYSAPTSSSGSSDSDGY
jgi:hypothetical protein